MTATPGDLVKRDGSEVRLYDRTIAIDDIADMGIEELYECQKQLKDLMGECGSLPIAAYLTTVNAEIMKQSTVIHAEEL